MVKKKNFILILLCTILIFSFTGCNSSKVSKKAVNLTISAAASLKEAMAEIETKFKKDYPDISLTFNFGSSGSLQQQIQNGAPSDVFISASESQMEALYQKNLILVNSKKDLIRNSLVLISAKNSSFQGVNSLTISEIKHIAIGEPSSVPAGKYANETLTNLCFKENIESKLVFAKDVKEVLAWVASGNAEVGFVYNSDVVSNDSVELLQTITPNLHSPIIYPVGIIKDTKNPNESKIFEDYLFNDKSQKIFVKYGYESLQNKY